MYRLVLNNQVSVDRIDTLSIVDVELANQALDAWEDVQARNNK